MELPINPFLNVHEKYSNMKIINPYRFAGGGGTSNGLLNNLISCYELDETSGSTAYDSHGSNDGTHYDNPTLNQSGKINKCYLFDSNYESINLGPLTPSNFSSIISISAWVNVTDTFNNKPILYRWYGVGSQQFIFRINGNSVQFYIKQGNGTTTVGGTFSGSIPNIYVDTWYHIVAVADGDNLYVYVNGIQATTTYSYDGTINSSSDLDDINVHIAASEFGGSYTASFRGLIDQIALWSRALTSTEVETLYNSGDGLAYSNWTT